MSEENKKRTKRGGLFTLFPHKRGRPSKWELECKEKLEALLLNNEPQITEIITQTLLYGEAKYSVDSDGNIKVINK